MGRGWNLGNKFQLTETIGIYLYTLNQCFNSTLSLSKYSECTRSQSLFGNQHHIMQHLFIASRSSPDLCINNQCAYARHMGRLDLMPSKIQPLLYFDWVYFIWHAINFNIACWFFWWFFISFILFQTLKMEKKRIDNDIFIALFI